MADDGEVTNSDQASKAPENPTVSQPVQPPPVGEDSTQPHRVLWMAIALLTGLSVFFAMMWGLTSNELASYKKGTAVTTVTAGTKNKTPESADLENQGPNVSAQPTQNDQQKMLAKLPRRVNDDPRAVGKVDAPIVLTEWADFRCPYCAKWALGTLSDLKPYIDSGSLRVEFRDMAIFEDESTLAHKASRAAAKQGKYWQWSNQMWSIHTGQGHPTVTKEVVIDLAKKAQVPNIDQFTTDLDDAEIAKAVETDTNDAKKLGVNGTPFFVINTTPISGALPSSSFIKVIEQYGGKK